MTFLTYLHQTKDTGRIFYIGKGNHRWRAINNPHKFSTYFPGEVTN